MPKVPTWITGDGDQDNAGSDYVPANGRDDWSCSESRYPRLRDCLSTAGPGTRKSDVPMGPRVVVQDHEGRRDSGCSLVNWNRAPPASHVGGRSPWNGSLRRSPLARPANCPTDKYC